MEAGAERLARSGAAITRTWDRLRVVALPSREALGAQAADHVAGRLRALLTSQAQVRVAFAAAASQSEFLDSLARADTLDWTRIQAFQLDEYIGLPRRDSRTFASWLDRHFFSRVQPGRVEVLDGSTADPAIEGKRYGTLIADGGLDLALVGVGDNGHVAFNEPSVADFRDPETVKLVDLDETSRLQQVRDGEFQLLASVPQRALTLTMSAILGSRAICAVVPGKAKAAAIASLLEGPISPQCPSSALRCHPDAVLFADADALSYVRFAPEVMR
jgi:glucosamine-6-phosphate deaminase